MADSSSVALAKEERLHPSNPLGSQPLAGWFPALCWANAPFPPARRNGGTRSGSTVWHGIVLSKIQVSSRQILYLPRLARNDPSYTVHLPRHSFKRRQVYHAIAFKRRRVYHAIAFLTSVTLTKEVAQAGGT